MSACGLTSRGVGSRSRQSGCLIDEVEKEVPNPLLLLRDCRSWMEGVPHRALVCNIATLLFRGVNGAGYFPIALPKPLLDNIMISKTVLRWHVSPTTATNKQESQ